MGIGHGGKREGAGRPKGAKNHRSRELVEAAAASGLLPHEFLLAVVRGERIPLPAEGKNAFHAPTFDQRLEAAKAVAPYYAPKLAAIEHTGADGGPIDQSITVRFVSASAQMASAQIDLGR